MSKNALLNIILERKSVRHFTVQPVPKPMLDTLMRAGMAAPSAKNKQPWAFVAVTDRNILDTMANGLPSCKMLAQAQAAIVVCGDMKKVTNDVDKSYWTQDCAAVTQNILLAAEAMGLGAVWTAAYPYKERTVVVVKALQLPDDILPLNVIPIGYPTGEDLPKDKYKPENIHWEKW
ncbi:MAG: nitroreductase family protein [Bacteroidales bacterium]|nr:nitroreductase family protein [Bacteroidales bacterium]